MDFPSVLNAMLAGVAIGNSATNKSLWSPTSGALTPFILIFLGITFGEEILKLFGKAISSLFKPKPIAKGARANRYVIINGVRYLKTEAEAKEFLSWSGLSEMPSGKKVVRDYGAHDADGVFIEGSKVTVESYESEDDA